MTVMETLARQGERFFRWRSYLPPALAFTLFPLALLQMSYPFGSYGAYEVRTLLCLLISLGGMTFRFIIAGYIPQGTSGTNTREQKAVSLNTTGIYSVVRHPLYLGNFLIWLGLAGFTGLWWFILLIVCFFCLFYERIMVAEENFLAGQFGEEFFAWVRETPAIIPRWRNWRPSPLPFSWRAAVRREYRGFTAVILGYYVLMLAGTLAVEGRLYASLTSSLLAFLTLVGYLMVRYLKKHTNFLQVAGR
uniref:DUF1295 domain-containing protein n=1 Tax=Desulfobacca acetoxidans TaxID=60893 RepID=A0A7V4G665_9BACT